MRDSGEIQPLQNAEVPMQIAKVHEESFPQIWGKGEQLALPQNEVKSGGSGREQISRESPI